MKIIITKALSFTVMLLMVVSCQRSAIRNSTAHSGTRPNIIVIMSDDMGYSDIGCYGSEISTPNLDSLAASGLRYTHFYNTGRCCPTRASLLTGLYAHQAGIGQMTNDNNLPGYRGDLSRNAVTIAEVLKTAGYSTYMSGKWHVTKHLLPDSEKYNWPLQRGFDRFYGTIIGAGSFYDPWTLTRGNKAITPDNDEHYKPEQYYYTDAISDNAVSFVNDHKKKGKENPFFMYVSYTAAHWPMHALEKDIAKYKGKYDAGYETIRKARYERMKKLGVIKDWDLSDAPQLWKDFPEDQKAWEIRCMEVYAAMVDNMDQGIGRLVKSLKENGQYENTLILFFQDNGGCAENRGRKPRKDAVTGIVPMGADELQTEMVPKRSRRGHPVLTGPNVMPGPSATYIAYGRNWANVSNTPFRRYKSQNHEGGIATPLIAHWPERIKAKNQLRDQPGHLIDVMATCVDLSGAKYPKKYNGKKIQPMEGQSLAASFDSNAPKDRLLMWEHYRNAAIRLGKWKLVKLNNKAAGWELYDMDKDRSELNDLAKVYPEKAKELEALWEKHAHRTKIYPKPGSKKKKRDKVVTEKKLPRLPGESKTKLRPINNNPKLQIRFSSIKEARARREKLIQFIWPEGLPTKCQPMVTKNVGETAFNEHLKGVDSSLSAGVDRLDTEVLGLRAFSYLIHPVKSSNTDRLAIVHAGHSRQGDYMKKTYVDTIDLFLKTGYSVVMMHMPIQGWHNDMDAKLPNGKIAEASSHAAIVKLAMRDSSLAQGAGFRPFLEPVITCINYWDGLSKDPLDVTMIGLSGGGWTTHLIAALDTRVRLNLPVAGSYPLYLRNISGYAGTKGDLEQFFPPLYDENIAEDGSGGGVATWLEIYALGGIGPDRQQIMVTAQYDSCCFNGDPEKTVDTFIDIVANSVKKSGLGQWQHKLDTTHQSHMISPWVIEKVLAPLLPEE